VTPPLVTDEDLSAYVDGALPVERQAEIAAWLAANKEAAETVSAYRAQARALKEAFEPILREPVPSRMLTAGRMRPPLKWAAGIAASLMLVSVGAASGYYGAIRSLPPPLPVEQQTFGARAAQAHAVFAPEVRHPVEVAADEQAHLLAWLSKRVGAKVRAPTLTNMGFDLVGGRLLSDPAGPAAQLMYQDGQGRRVTLYVISGEGHGRESAFRWAKEGGVEVCFWVDGSVHYALAAELDRKEIYRLAKMVYQQFNG
jgi:anti-sigma factor RsiW